MIFHRRHIHQQSVCNSFSADFPALFCWIEFWCVFWEVPNLESFLVVFQKLLNVRAFMSTRYIKNTLCHLFRSSLQNFKKAFWFFFDENINTKAHLLLAPNIFVYSYAWLITATGLLPFLAQPLDTIGIKPKVASSSVATTKPFFL